MLATAEEMRRRAPGMMRDPVEPPGSLDPREGIGGSQLSRRDRSKGRGAMIPLQGCEFPRCALHFGERSVNFGRNAPARLV
jgi:hypothetical protein